MDREFRLELITYSIRCKKCNKHKPLYLHPDNYNTVKELTELYCKWCLGKVEVEVKSSKTETKPRDKITYCPYCATKLTYNHQMSEDEGSDIYECSGCQQTIYWNRDY